MPHPITEKFTPEGVAKPPPAIRQYAILLFNSANQLWLRRDKTSREWVPSRSGAVKAAAGLEPAAQQAAAPGGPVKPIFDVTAPPGTAVQVFFALLGDEEAGAIGQAEEGAFFSIEEARRAMAEEPAEFAGDLREMLSRIDDHLLRIPYLYKEENDYIYRFRTEKQRNRSVYHIDLDSERLYQSALCRTIKAAKRVNERSSSSPAVVDFGAVSYVLPSHFGFCLGVQNAIERAYESIAENPGRRVFMLSELIHNPFVNEDLLARGLRYLQSDKGQPLVDPDTGKPYWEQLRRDDVVVIPAFGATDEDKIRLVEKGIAINRYDATCMLVEKVWKAAQRFGRSGHTVLIHGKAEHEETKATFSNAAKAGPALIVRNMEEAERLGAAILAATAEEKQRILSSFAGRHTAGFDPARHLERVAVVNQTTLLRNETLQIINYLEGIFARKFGEAAVPHHLNSNSKGDTLCYATQVNQDALEKALAIPLDLAVVAGGKNSSNTYQLFRMCQERVGERAFYIQSERNILSAAAILHYQFSPGGARGGEMTEKPFLPAGRPLRILLTGGASCPDGIIQQIVTRINSLLPPDALRPVEDVLGDWQDEESHA
jgi:4-hydroxy-3-methylbut-2-en-1-yl diphosphate reductase